MSSAISIMFGDDVPPNQVGIRKLSESGFQLNDLISIQKWFEQKNCICKLINLHWLLDEEYQNTNKSYILIIQNAVNVMMDDENASNHLLEEQNKLQKDTKGLMYGRVVNRHTRHHLTFSDCSREPCYEKGLGRIYNFTDLPQLNKIREKIFELTNEKLEAESNYYYDTTKCGIGFHGDEERKKIIGIRLGSTIPISYAWFHKNTKITDTIQFMNLQHGDMYIMSEKTSGYDWKIKTKYTLRHAVGGEKFTKL